MNADKRLNDVLFRAKSKVEPQVRSILNTSGWPEDITMQLTLVMERGRLGLYVPPELRDTVNDLEYGTFGRSPSYVIRKIDALIDRYVGNELERLAEDFIFSEDVLL